MLEKLYDAFIANGWWKTYLEGLGNTLLISVVACAIGLILGAIIAIAKYFSAGKTGLGWRVLGAVANLYTTVIRGTPVMLQLLIIYGLAIWSEGLYTCFIGFGLNSAAYVSEIIRAGIGSVDQGQMEAGRSLGLSQLATMRCIVFPQAVKNILPAMFNEFISLIKETSIAGYVAVLDLTKAATIVNSRVANLIPHCITAVAYLIMVIGLSQVQKRLERRLARSDRN